MTGPPGAAEKFGADGRCTDEPARTFVGAQMVALQAWIGTLRRMVAAGCRRPAAGGRAPRLGPRIPTGAIPAMAMGGRGRLA